MYISEYGSVLPGGRREAQLPNPTGGLLYLCVSIARDIAVL